MYNLKAFLGYPVDFNGICEVYAPKIKEVIGLDKYGIYQKLLTISQEEIYDSINENPIDGKPHFTIPISEGGAPQPVRATPKINTAPSPLEYILINCYQNKSFLKITQEAFEFFTHEEILPMYEEKMIYIGKLEDITKYNNLSELPTLNESNFFDFQNLIRSLVGQKIIEPPDPNEDPRITRMKAKARYRDKVKMESGQSIGLSEMLVAICCMGIGITPLNIGEMSYTAIQALFSTYQNKEKYELDIQSLLAGADSKKIKPKYWITNLNE